MLCNHISEHLDPLLPPVVMFSHWLGPPAVELRIIGSETIINIEKGSQTFVCFGDEFSIHFPCRGEMLAIHIRILQSLVKSGSCCGKNEVDRLQDFKI